MTIKEELEIAKESFIECLPLLEALALYSGSIIFALWVTPKFLVPIAVKIFFN